MKKKKTYYKKNKNIRIKKGRCPQSFFSQLQSSLVVVVIFSDGGRVMVVVVRGGHGHDSSHIEAMERQQMQEFGVSRKKPRCIRTLSINGNRNQVGFHRFLKVLSISFA